MGEGRRCRRRYPRYFYSHLCLRVAELRSMFPIQMSAQRDKPAAALAEVSNLEELDNVGPSSSNLVVTTVASRCE